MIPVFDFYDDSRGEILKQYISDINSVPTIIKEAKKLSREELDTLPDSEFALVVMDGDNKLRKFATIDPGNTLLSSLYLQENLAILPPEMAKEASVKIGAAIKRFQLGIEPPAVEFTPVPEEKRASRYCLNGKYPIDTYGQVTQAIGYFEKYASHFVPEERREYCSNLVNRAEELAITCSEDINKYAGTELDETFPLYMKMRETICDPQFKSQYEKVATIIPSMQLDDATTLLNELDKDSGLYCNEDVPDPYITLCKYASPQVDNANYSWMGNKGDMVLGYDLEKASKNSQVMALLGKQYNANFTTKFVANPVAAFKTLPPEHKEIVSRLLAR